MVKIKEKKSKNREYCDSNCYNQRKDLQRLANVSEKNPDNLTIRQSYHQTKSMIKSKKREHRELNLKFIAGLKPNGIKRNGKLSNQLQTLLLRMIQLREYIKTYGKHILESCVQMGKKDDC